MYGDGCAAIKAVRDRLTAGDGHYLFGKRPCSLDAKLYGLLTYILSAPIVAPVLKDLVKDSPSLMAYVELISQTFFTMAAPSVRNGDLDGAWSPAAKGATAAPVPKQTEEEKKMKRRSMYWVGGAATLLVAYVALGGQYFDIGLAEEIGDEDDEE